jgi:hypothetical protein
MNLATALKERTKIEFEMSACSLRNFAFGENAGLTTFASPQIFYVKLQWLRVTI